MAYGELLQALEAEVRDQCRALAADARSRAVRVIEEGRERSSVAREQALARAAAEGEALGERARRQAALVEERAVLGEQQRLLDDVRERARERLSSLSTPALTCSLLAEVLDDDDGSPLVVTCDPGHGESCRGWLAAHRRDAAARIRVEEAQAVRGGVELSVGTSLVVDDTLPARLEQAWPGLLPELGRILFGGDDG